MENILTVSQMRYADNKAINELGISGALLMENAARSSAEYLESIFEEYELFGIDVDIICGSGNNGGDGFALARHLMEINNVRVIWLGSEEKMSSETFSNYASVIKLGIEIIHLDSVELLDSFSFSEDCIIDSMIGVGGSENIRGLANDVLNSISEYDSLKIAIDAPTGLNTDTGKASYNCFEADYTITMFASKIGMHLNQGPDYCGTILKANLGVPEYITTQTADTFAIEDVDLFDFLPLRYNNSSKFDYGRVMVIAGSDRYPGAAALCSNSVIKSGAGLVQLYSTKFHPLILPEVICVELEKNDNAKNLKIISKDIEKANVILIGPGLGDDVSEIELINEILSKIDDDQIVVIDADGLRAINQDSKLTKNFILTPHSGEFSRITNVSRKDIETNPHEFAKSWSEKLNCNILLKTRPVVISNPEVSFLNLNGNSGMATGGSGDVLAGIIAGLASQGLSALDSGVLAAYIHAKAGDIYLSDYNEYTLTATDLVNNLKEAMTI